MTKRMTALVMALGLSGTASAETLRDAIAAAYATNPQLAAAKARQEALTETPEQARAMSIGVQKGPPIGVQKGPLRRVA